MSSIFYPVTHNRCPWQCTFCGIPSMERILIDSPVSDDALATQFKEFLSNGNNLRDITRHRRIAIAPNGSIAPEVPRTLRERVLTYCDSHDLTFESELIATLIDEKAARDVYGRHYRKGMFQTLLPQQRAAMADAAVADIRHALDIEFPNKNVLLNLGLEVANEDDLRSLNKYTHRLDDYVACAVHLRERGIKVGANILVGAPGITDGARSALETVRFAFETLKADKILMITWNPVKYTAAKKRYDRGEIDVMSATEAAAIYQAVKARYGREKSIEFNNMRSYIYHGKHENFRAERITTDRQKRDVCERVAASAKEILG